jgi:hypothetical protein
MTKGTGTDTPRVLDWPDGAPILLTDDQIRGLVSQTVAQVLARRAERAP